MVFDTRSARGLAWPKNTQRDPATMTAKMDPEAVPAHTLMGYRLSMND